MKRTLVLFIIVTGLAYFLTNNQLKSEIIHSVNQYRDGTYVQSDEDAGMDNQTHEQALFNVDEIESRLYQQLKEELMIQLKSELEVSLQESLTLQIKSELETMLREELIRQLKSELETELSEELTLQIKAQLETELTEEITKQIDYELQEMQLLNTETLETTEQSIIQLVETNLGAVIGVSNFKRETNTWVEQSTGTGVIFKQVDDMYYLITNEHVVNGADQLRIYTKQTGYVNANLIAIDPVYDLALLQFTSTASFATSQFADSETLTLGQMAIAIGNPMGYQFYQSVTMGVISGLNRSVSGEFNEPVYLQHDVSISPGNSGGPLYNLEGYVIGINTFKLAEPDASNMNFAIPSNLVVTFINNHL